MKKKTLSVALAYVGVMVGAGFASGREMVQYFVSFGWLGFIGLAIVALVFTFTGNAILGLGSYFRANEHSDVLEEIARPWAAKILDIGFMVTCFTIGFVMISGAGANLQQQFGIPAWVGALGLSLAIFISGMFDIDIVTKIIGAVTPFLIIFVVGASIYIIVTTDIDLQQSQTIASNLPTPVPNIVLSALNYVALNLMIGTSMAFVVSGEQLNTKAARLGGILGGLLISILLFVATGAMFVKVEQVGALPLPMLAIVDEIHPLLGDFMSVVVLGMIFNTGLGMYYSLASRISDGQGGHFKRNYMVLIILGFGLSFLGFKELVEMIYPLIGYMGIFLLIVLSIGWYQNRSDVYKEELRRRVLFRAMYRKYNDDLEFQESDQKAMERIIRQSHIDNEELKKDMREEVNEYMEESEN